MPGNWQVAPVGPPGSKGVLETGTPSEIATGVVRRARNVVLTGANKVIAGPGTEVMMTFKDDQGSPATVTSIRAMAPYTDQALVVAYSSVTQKVYLYRVVTDFSGWYNAAGALQSNTTASPVGVLWPAAGEAAVTSAIDVMIAEGLGTAFFATPASLSAASLNYRLRQYTIAGGLADVTSNLDGTGMKPVYANGCLSFQQHLWIWGFGSDSSRFRPELLRFSAINFDTSGATGLFLPGDSFGLGDSVASKKERVLAAGVAGDAMIVGAASTIVRITGYGRDSWFKTSMDKSYGIAGVKALLSRGTHVYYWAPQVGPMRIDATGQPEILWPRVGDTAKSVPNPASVVVGYDDVYDQVLFFFDPSGSAAGAQSFMAYDRIRDAWFGPDSDVGLPVSCAATIERVLDPSIALPAPAAPTSPTTSAIGQTVATAGWTLSTDSGSTYYVRIKPTSTGSWTGISDTLVGLDVASYTFTGLTISTSYDWQVRAYKNGQYSAYTTVTTFTTSAALQPPTSPSAVGPGRSTFYMVGSWVNAEPSAQTEVWFSTDNITFSLVQTVAAGSSSYTYYYSPRVAGTYYMKFRHNNGSSTSAFTSSVSAYVS